MEVKSLKYTRNITQIETIVKETKITTSQCLYGENGYIVMIERATYLHT